MAGSCFAGTPASLNPIEHLPSLSSSRCSGITYSFVQETFQESSYLTQSLQKFDNNLSAIDFLVRHMKYNRYANISMKLTIPHYKGE